MPYNSEFFYGSYTSEGGKLSHWTSDDFLDIPPGAIPEGESWEICGKIHTSLDKFKDAILKGEMKQFRSCVLEYRIKNGPKEDNQKFLKPIIINIRHSVTDVTARNNLRVFCIEDDGQTIEIVKLTDQLGDSMPWFELCDDFLKIFTYHFCHYTCVCTASKD